MKIFVKHVLTAVAFLGGLVLMLCLLSFAFKPDDDVVNDGIHSINANGIIGEDDNTIDAIFLGDSEIYASISPMQIWEEQGIPTFCVSTSGQKLWYSHDLLQKALRKQSPKIVLLDTDTIFKKFDFDDSLMHRFEMAMPVFKYHDRWKVFVKEAVGEELDGKDYNDYKGYRYSDKIVPANTDNYMKPSKSVAYIARRNKNYVKEIKEYCDERGVKIMFISIPSTKNWDYSKHNAIAELAKELDVDYIDLNTLRDEVPIDWSTDTRDKGDHINYYGAVKVTSYVGQYLKDTGLFTDHRGEEKYSRWDKLLKSYKAYVDKLLSNGIDDVK